MNAIIHPEYILGCKFAFVVVTKQFYINLLHFPDGVMSSPYLAEVRLIKLVKSSRYLLFKENQH